MVLGAVIEARDAYTGGHLWRVAQFSRLLAERAGLDRDQVFLATIGGFMHDLGKIGVPDHILRKAGALSPDEYAVIKTHPAIGRDILLQHPLAPLVMDAVAYHHERADGTGYPEGLPGGETPLAARIVSISDAFDAMTSTRPYRRGMPIEQALNRLREGKGSQFDSALVDLFVGLGEQGGLNHVVGHSDVGRRLVTCPTCGPIMAIPRDADMDAVHFCRACGGAYRLHPHGDRFDLELIGMGGGPNLAPKADRAQIAELAASY